MIRSARLFLRNVLGLLLVLQRVTDSTVVKMCGRIKERFLLFILIAVFVSPDLSLLPLGINLFLKVDV